MKKHNFYAGPSIMPQYTNEKVIEAIRDFAGTGLSIMEVSHRSKEFIAVMEQARQLIKELLEVPDGYTVLFLQGGASLQFLMAPMNLLETKAAYLKNILKNGSYEAKILKVADRISNLTDLHRDVYSEEKMMKYLDETEEYVIPMAKDVNHNMVTELTDLIKKRREMLQCVAS